jgi:hypothetical protein
MRDKVASIDPASNCAVRNCQDLGYSLDGVVLRESTFPMPAIEAAPIGTARTHFELCLLAASRRTISALMLATVIFRGDRL